MKKILVSLAIAFCAIHAQGQNIEGQPIASQYGTWKVPGYSPAAYGGFAPTSCRVQGGASFFFAFNVGTPLKIVDSNPALSETVTPTAVTNTNVTCGITISPTHQHNLPFYFTSATGGLQEALNENLTTPATNTIVLDNKFYQLVGGTTNAAAVIASVQGSANLGLVDVTQVPTVWYKWNGSQYIAVSPSDAASASTQISDLIATNNAGILSDLSHYYAISSTYTTQAAITAAAANSGAVTIQPGAGHQVFTNPNGVRVNDNRTDIPANARSFKEFGAQCDVRPLVNVTITAGTNTATMSTFGQNFSTKDNGATLIFESTVAGVPTVFEPTVTYLTNGSVQLSTNAPWTATQSTIIGHDDTAAMQNAIFRAKGIVSNQSTIGTPLVIPGTNGCLTHSLIFGSVSLYGVGMGNSSLYGFPGEDVLQAYDPSNPPASGYVDPLGTNLVWQDFSVLVDQSIDATQPWNIINAAGATVPQTPYYRPIGYFSVWANNPLGPGWIAPAAGATAATNGVASVTNGSASVSVDPSETAPAVGEVVVFPYTSPVFSATVSSVAGQAVTLSANYTGATSAQQEWFAGSQVQTLAASMGTGDTTMTVNLSVTPSPLSESNVAGHGVIQVDSEQMSYYGVDWVGGKTFKNLVRGINGTTAATHSPSAVIVPLNPFHPTAPWPVTPTVNTGTLTPAGAEFYGAWNVGNAGVSFPMTTGHYYVGMTDSIINNINVVGINSGADNSAGWWFVQYPYEDHFNFITAYGLEYGIAFGQPINSHTFFQQGPTCNAITIYNAKIRSAHAATMNCGGNATFADWGVYNGPSNNTPTQGNSSTGIAMLHGEDDQTGANELGGAFDRFVRVYYEANFYQQSPEPTNELDDVGSRYESDLFGGGYQWAALGGSKNIFDQVEFQTKPNAPLVVWGMSNEIKNGFSLGGGENSIGSTFAGGSAAVSYGYGNSISGYWNGSGPPMVHASGSLGTAGIQKGDFLAAGAAANPFLDYLSGLITPYELANEKPIDANYMNGGLLFDATAPVTGNKIGCAMAANSSGPNCSPVRFNGESYIAIGTGQRIIPGQYALYIPVEATAPTSFEIQVGGFGTGCGVLTNIPVTIAAANTWQVASAPLVDFTPYAGLGCSLQLKFTGVGSGTAAATVYMAYAGFQPYIQNLYAQNINLPVGSTGGTATGCAQSPVTGINNGFTCPTKGWYAYLGAAEGATDTTVTLTSSTSGYSPAGCFIVDSEYECYTGKSGNTLTGLTRGQYTTTAAAHTSGQSVESADVVLGSLQQTPSVEVVGGGTAPPVLGVNNSAPNNHSGVAVLDINSGANEVYVNSGGSIIQANPSASNVNAGSQTVQGSLLVGTAQIDPPIVSSGNVLQTSGPNQAYYPIGFGAGIAGSLDIVQPTTIGAPTVVQAAAGGTSTRSYLCTGTDIDGNLIPGTTYTGSTFASTYSYPNYIAVTCPFTAGVNSYTIWRTAGGPNQGYIASGSHNGFAEAFDYNESATAGTPPTTNTSNPQIRVHGSGTPGIALGTLATIYAGAGVPTGCGTTYPNSSLYLNSTGSAGSILYACIGTTWTDVK